jgi:hypothetical protein
MANNASLPNFTFQRLKVSTNKSVSVQITLPKKSSSLQAHLVPRES